MIDEQLRKRVEDKHGPLHEIEVPTDPKKLLASCCGMTQTSFFALFDAERINPGDIKPPKKKGSSGTGRTLNPN